MTEFNDLELSEDVDELSEEEAKKTLSQFMESHAKNRSSYDELQTELSETETNYEEKVEELEERISEFREQRAEEAAEYVRMPESLLADRFSIDELEQIIEEGSEAEFSQEQEEPEEEDDSPLTDFADREEKGRQDGDNRAEYRQRAESVLSRRNFPLGE